MFQGLCPDLFIHYIFVCLWRKKKKQTKLLNKIRSRVCPSFVPCFLPSFPVNLVWTATSGQVLTGKAWTFFPLSTFYLLYSKMVMQISVLDWDKQSDGKPGMMAQTLTFPAFLSEKKTVVTVCWTHWSQHSLSVVWAYLLHHEKKQCCWMLWVTAGVCHERDAELVK